MTDPAPTLRAAREEAIDVLCREFARDTLALPDLERRLTRAREARTVDELRALLAELPAIAPVPAGRGGRVPTEPADATRTTPARTAERRRGSHLAFAVMGGTRRAGKWQPPGSMFAFALMGGVELDFREAVLGPGVTEINVFAFWGGVEITVPPSVHVDTHGMAIMGGFEQAADQESRAPEGAPTIRINGLAIMAGVEVKVRSPGETDTKKFQRDGRREGRRRNAEP